MKINLRFFAYFQEIIGAKHNEIIIPEDSTLEALLTRLKKEFKFLKNKDHLLVAVNGKYVDSSVLLKEGDEVALFPPVSGG